MLHVTKLEVRTYECDSNRHVNNAVYLQYLEYARTNFLTDIGIDYHEMKNRGYAIFVTEINIKYLSAARWGDFLFIETVSLKKRKMSGVFRQIIRHEGGPKVCVAEVKWAFVTEGGKPVPLPPEFDKEELYPHG